MLNILETVRFYEDLRRLSEIIDTDNLDGIDSLDEIDELAKIIDYKQNDKINYHLLKDLQYYGGLLKAEEEMVICIKDLNYAVASYDQCRIDVKIRESDCFKVVGYTQEEIIFKSFNGGITIRMKKDTFRYYFGVINSKGKSIKEFFNSKIFIEMDNDNEN